MFETIYFGVATLFAVVAVVVAALAVLSGACIAVIWTVSFLDDPYTHRDGLGVAGGALGAALGVCADWGVSSQWWIAGLLLGAFVGIYAMSWVERNFAPIPHPNGKE